MENPHVTPALLRSPGTRVRLSIGVVILFANMALPGTVAAKPLSAYFQPMPSACPLTSNTWGDKAVLPRDICNGMEDPTGTPTTRGQWMYWDGKILRGPDSRYHLFASRWAHSAGMNGWYNSDAIHAVSPALLGKYEDQGFAFNDGPNAQAPHKGHNVTASELPDGTYALIVNEIVPFTIFTATSLDGPWKNRGHAVIDKNGVPLSIPPPGDQNLESNVSFTVRHDGNFQIVQRHGIVAISTTGLLGPYKVQQPTTTYAAAEAVPASLASIYPNRKKHLSSQAPATVESTYVYAEDPLIWYSGGQYHVIYNYPDDRAAYHLTSPDGVHGWTDQGLAFDPRDSALLFRNSDGTVNRWHNIERPNVIMENGHITHFTFAVSDVFKMQISGTSNNNTKVLVVPFDGVLFDEETGLGGKDAGVDGSGDGGTVGRDAGPDGAGGIRTGGTTAPTGTGGTSGSGGVAGSVGSGGSSSTGGTSTSPGSGGTIGSGGVAGNVGSGGSATGGGKNTGGLTTTGGAIRASGGSTGVVSTGGVAPRADKGTGCGCTLAGAKARENSHTRSGFAFLFGFFLFGYMRRRARTRRHAFAPQRPHGAQGDIEVGRLARASLRYPPSTAA